MGDVKTDTKQNNNLAEKGTLKYLLQSR